MSWLGMDEGRCGDNNNDDNGGGRDGANGDDDNDSFFVGRFSDNNNAHASGRGEYDASDERGRVDCNDDCNDDDAETSESPLVALPSRSSSLSPPRPPPRAVGNISSLELIRHQIGIDVLLVGIHLPPPDCRRH